MDAPISRWRFMSAAAKAISPEALLITRFMNNLGGIFHEKSAELWEELHRKWPQDAKVDEARVEARELREWMITESKGNESDSLDHLFHTAVRSWARKVIIHFLDDKQALAEFAVCERIAMLRSDSRLTCDVRKAIDSRAQPPIMEEVDGFVLFDDGIKRQVAILKEWYKDPCRLVESAPRVKAVFERLKTSQTKS